MIVWIMSTDYTELSRGTGPIVGVMAEFADGRAVTLRSEHAREDYSLGAAAGEVRVGGTSIRATSHGFVVRVEVDGFVLDARMRPRRARWTPGIVMGDGYGWDVIAPSADVEVTYALGDRRATTTGAAYLDRNWGSEPVESLFDHCWWSRGRIDDYVFVTATLVPRVGSGEGVRHLLHLSDGAGEVLADERADFRVSTIDDPVTGRAIPGSLEYEQPAVDGGQARLGFRSETVLHRGTALTQTVGIGGLTGRMVGKDGAHFRFFGAAQVERRHGGATVDRAVEDATWELIYFPGSTR